ncbi:MAG: hypothetical protein AAGH81_18325 [Bacteroidota bacterium]
MRLTFEVASIEDTVHGLSELGMTIRPIRMDEQYGEEIYPFVSPDSMPQETLDSGLFLSIFNRKCSEFPLIL